MVEQPYIERAIEKRIKKLAASFSAVVLSGPRQSGKSTTLRRLFGNSHQYITFDDPIIREKCLEDPRLFLDSLPERIILDEIQYAPKLLSYIKILIDNDRPKKGRFIITGSQQFNLIKELGDTLAGRAALLTLLPFNYLEIKNLYKRVDARAIFIDACLNGSYPELKVNSKIEPNEWYSAYLRTYLERDVRGLHNVGNLSDFQKFMRLLAVRCAQTLNLTSFADDLGVAVNTIKNWLSILSASQIIFLLSPYYRNIGKRLVKSPKLYFNDCGLVSFLTGLRTQDHVLNGPLAGQLFENYVISETNKILTSRTDEPGLYFMRTSRGEEIDLLVENDSSLLAAEIKMTKTPRSEMTRALKDLIPKLRDVDVKNSILVCLINHKLSLTRTINAVNVLDYFKSYKA